MAAQGYARILEVKLVSAQDLATVSKSMKTYAVVWVDPLRKMTTRVDQLNDANPIWDDKFVFRVDDKFLSAPDSALEVEIYAAAWTRDALIGTVRVLVGDLLAVSKSTRFTPNHNNKTMRFMELQVWRPSGRPQGMVTMGVALLDSTLRSMPLATEQMVSSFRGEKNIQNPKHIKDQIAHNYHAINEDSVPRRLRRSHSDQTELTTSEVSGCTYTNTTTSAITASAITVSVIPSAVEKGGESIVNSDLGPSASVVAEAIAKAMYLKQKAAETSTGSESDVVVKTEKQEKRRGKTASSSRGKEDHKQEKRERRRRRRRERETGRGLFSCFGSVFGLEISITCGGGHKSPKKKSKSNKVCNLSSVDGYSLSNTGV